MDEEQNLWCEIDFGDLDFLASNQSFVQCQRIDLEFQQVEIW